MAIATINPTTGETLKKFDALTDAQLERKLEVAAEAFSKYRKTSFADRARHMQRAAEILEGQKEAFARMMTTEMGKTFRSAIDEAVKCAWVCRFYAENGEKFLADEVIATTAARSYVRYQPLGADSRRDALELSFLAGDSGGRADLDGRQRDAAQARVQRAAVRADDRRALPRRRLSRRRVSNAADRIGQSGEDTDRSPRGGA